MWNAQRTQTLYRAFYQMLYPLFAKELEEKLLEEAKDFVIKVKGNKRSVLRRQSRDRNRNIK